MHGSNVQVRDRRLYDPQRAAAFGPEFRNDHEGEQFLGWVAERQRRAELNGPLGMAIETWDNSRLNDVFRDFYLGCIDGHGRPPHIWLWYRPDDNLSAAPEPVAPRAGKPLPRWLAWLDRRS